eukprot:TRINITY_DN7563_c0_g1_i1.p1 TRINITY_DN7563_c0_g1~~TRINITY_DN7563_c0_g1_i1.p1  ORF type:complete len:772 (+),score=173.12 TRINITY_DN7563_c0_g1_i1:157-2472(+)
MQNSSIKREGCHTVLSEWATSPEREVPVPHLLLPPHDPFEKHSREKDVVAAEAGLVSTLQPAPTIGKEGKARSRRMKKHEVGESPPRPLAFRPVARATETAQALSQSWMLKAKSGGSSSSSCSPAAGTLAPSANSEDVAADAQDLLRVLRAAQQPGRLEPSSANPFPQQPAFVSSSVVAAVELGDLKQRVASVEQVLGTGLARNCQAATRPGLPALLSEAEQEGRQLSKPQEHQVPLQLPDPLTPANATDAAGGGTGGSWERSNDLAVIQQELLSWQRRHASAEAELATQSAAHALQVKSWEARQAERQAERSTEVEEFAKVCAEALLGAGAAEEQAVLEAKEAKARCEGENSDSELQAELDQKRCRLLREQESQLLALHEQNAAQTFNVAHYEEEVMRFREWSAAYEATARAEALTAHRFRSELSSAVQELKRYHLWHQQQLHQQALLSQARQSAEAVAPRLESIPESSRESSAGSYSPGRDDFEHGERDCSDAEQDPKKGAQIRSCSSECSLDSTVELECADGQDKENPRSPGCDRQTVEVQRLREELAVAEEQRKKAFYQRDEAEKALAELRQEHSAVLVALRCGARLPARLPCDPPHVAAPTTTDISNEELVKLDTGITARAQGFSSKMDLAPCDDSKGRLAEASSQLTEAMVELKRLQQTSCTPSSGLLHDCAGQVAKASNCILDCSNLGLQQPGSPPLPKPMRPSHVGRSSSPLHWSAPGRIVSNISPPPNSRAVPTLLQHRDAATWTPTAVVQRGASTPISRSW